MKALTFSLEKLDEKANLKKCFAKKKPLASNKNWPKRLGFWILIENIFFIIIYI